MGLETEVESDATQKGATVRCDCAGLLTVAVAVSVCA